jgi:hypothetical protein
MNHDVKHRHLRFAHVLRCVTCDYPIGTFRIGEAKALMTRCGRCKTLQHRHVG